MGLAGSCCLICKSATSLASFVGTGVFHWQGSDMEVPCAGLPDNPAGHVHRAYTIVFPAKPMYACRFSFCMVAFMTPFIHVRDCGGFAHAEINTCRTKPDLSKLYPSVSARNALASHVLPVLVCVWGSVTMSLYIHTHAFIHTHPTTTGKVSRGYHHAPLPGDVRRVYPQLLLEHSPSEGRGHRTTDPVVSLPSQGP